MKNSLIILLCFIAGVILSYKGFIPQYNESIGLYTLYLLMFLVGIGIGWTCRRSPRLSKNTDSKSYLSR